MRSTTSAGASRKATAARHSSACNRSCSAAKTTSRSASPTATARPASIPHVEVASLLENRATTRTGIFAQEFATAVGSEVTSASAYFLDTLKLSDSVAVTVSGRYDDTRIELSDRSGENPELDGNT